MASGFSRSECPRDPSGSCTASLGSHIASLLPSSASWSCHKFVQIQVEGIEIPPFNGRNIKDLRSFFKYYHTRYLACKHACVVSLTYLLWMVLRFSKNLCPRRCLNAMLGMNDSFNDMNDNTSQPCVRLIYMQIWTKMSRLRFSQCEQQSRLQSLG